MRTMLAHIATLTLGLNQPIIGVAVLECSTWVEDSFNAPVNVNLANPCAVLP